MKIIHITDPHLVLPGQTLWGTESADRMDRCLDDIARWHSDAAFCVISGDITNAGDSAAYGWVRERLQTFPLRTFLMIGNHDDRDKFRAAFPEVPNDDNGFVQYTHTTEQGVFLFLDTHKGGTVSQGLYCAERRRWLGDRLREAGDRPVYIFMHHPPFDIGLPYVDRIKLEEPEAFADVIASAKTIRHLFFGHVHRAAYINWRGIPCTALPGTNHQVPLAAASVATRYSFEPAMYAVVLLADDQVTVHFDACLDRTAIDDSL